jgi:hypothetical protein
VELTQFNVHGWDGKVLDLAELTNVLGEVLGVPELRRLSGTGQWFDLDNIDVGEYGWLPARESEGPSIDDRPQQGHLFLSSAEGDGVEEMKVACGEP